MRLRLQLHTTILMVMALLALGVRASDRPEIGTEEAPIRRLYFKIERNGGTIGHYHFDLWEKDSWRRVRVDMEARVRFLMLTVYHSQHESTGLWSGAQLHQFEGQSNYNGKRYTLELERDAAAGTAEWTVNDETHTLRGAYFSFVPWFIESEGEATLLTEKGRMRQVTQREIGLEEVTLDGRVLELRHYLLEGPWRRHVWYDRDGFLVLMEYEKSGDTIRLVRDFGVDGKAHNESR